VFVEVVKRADQFGFQHHRHCIELVWAIQCDDRDRAAVGHENRIVVHGIGAATTPGDLRPRPDALTLIKVAIPPWRRLPRGGQMRRSKMWAVASNPIFFQKRRPIAFRAWLYRSTFSMRRDRNHPSA